ncbi:hypothetical protein [Lapidilactobacillus bayanensis]|uniref:hypothetical protein n=1 Tax=Lapidilactobacillus bayanensis TaxID=2485998 RepID=UPI000F78B4AA|nr:hypothetical protein [Lapidilactobacillus bayanensis]
MKHMTLVEFRQLLGRDQVITTRTLLQACLRRAVPLHHELEFVDDFDVLINYRLVNPQGIKTLVISTDTVYFSTYSTKSLLQYRMANSILDVSVIRRLKQHLELPHNRELSLCFGNWCAMHLSGVSSSKSADWVALHHVYHLTKVAGREVEFDFTDGLRIVLPVRADFQHRFEDLCLMSVLELRAFEYLCREIGVDPQQLTLSMNVLRQQDDLYRQWHQHVTVFRIGQYLQLFQRGVVQSICHDESYEPVTQTFEDSESYFICKMKRWRSFN